MVVRGYRIVIPFGSFRPKPFSGLTFKGRGTRSGTDGTLSYGTVTEGSAPVAGDLVIWNSAWLAFAGVAPSDLTGSGWIQDYLKNTDTYDIGHIVLAKVVSASDVSSPPTIGNPTYGLAAMWAAFTVSGNISALSINGHDVNYGGASAAASVAVDSSVLSSPETAITLIHGNGTDGSIAVTGITLDKSITIANYDGGTQDAQLGYKLDVGGASYTIAKVDDGTVNSIAAAYVSVK